MQRFIKLICWLLILPISVFSQSRILTGTVVDSKGDPIPFSTIEHKGTSTATTAADNGRYSINVSGSDIILIVSSSGHSTREVNVGSASSYDVQLKESGNLSEVIVTALGIKREKKALGYSTQEVGVDELTASRQTNIVNALRGTCL